MLASDFNLDGELENVILAVVWLLAFLHSQGQKRTFACDHNAAETRRVEDLLRQGPTYTPTNQVGALKWTNREAAFPCKSHLVPLSNHFPVRHCSILANSVDR